MISEIMLCLHIKINKVMIPEMVLSVHIKSCYDSRDAVMCSLKIML